jgi:formylglycine-generating enzyme required for sulfatase activity
MNRRKDILVVLLALGLAGGIFAFAALGIRLPWVPSASKPASFTNSIGMHLVWVPPGTFTMGLPPAYGDAESPVHRVTITKGFYMGAYEVTQDEYQQLMGTTPSHFKKGGDYPVEQVSWCDAVEFCKKLSAKEGRPYRLPTEAEWEYACRAGTTTLFCYGDPFDALGDYAWFSDNSGGRTHAADGDCTPAATPWPCPVPNPPSQRSPYSAACPAGSNSAMGVFPPLQ